jgi:cell wall assembly regulator SMI1
MKNIDNIKQAWTYIAEWLDKEAKDFDRSVLAKGTSEAALARFQTEFDVKLPLDFCDSYRIHNGFAEKIGLIHAGDLLSISEIKKHYYRLTHKDSLVNWDANLFPFVEFNETDFLCLNLKDEQIYWVGINRADSSIESYKTANSFSLFLSNLANDLKLGNGCMGELLC